MNLNDLKSQLATKRRTVDDLARFISTRTDNNPNYTLLLGAGCSVSSGIRSAAELCEEWRKHLYLSLIGDKAKAGASVEEQREFLKTKEGSWYDPNREYSSLFEKKYDMQRQRRMFVEMEVSGKAPSIGYCYLTSLVGQNYFNTIFTTNFDDLVNEAFNLYSEQRPIVCAHDSSINSVTVTSKRPKIIKVHGDYLFDDLKSTTRETESLEQNMKSKFMEFAKDFGLIIVGYGGNDRSIVDILSSLLKNDEYLKGGIYWCIRKESDVSEDLRKLLWKEKVYFVEIDGFDELFAELYARFNEGEVLPVSATTISHRRNQMIEKLVSSQLAFPTTTDILRRAKEKLVRQSKRTALANLVFKPDDDELPFGAKNLKEDELIVLMEIQNLLSVNNYSAALDLAKKRLEVVPQI